MYLPDSFYSSRKLVNIVENQTTYELQDSAMHIFETHAQAKWVQLQFRLPVLASMLQGKKVMHLNNQKSFDFLPGESLILPSNELMSIDFPDSSKNTPTRCLALEIGEERIERVVQLMNEIMGKVEGDEWSLMDYNFHFTNDAGLYKIIQRIVYLYTENHPSKDLFVSNMLQELIIRILQANSKKMYVENTQEISGNNRFAYIIEYIRQNLARSLTVKELSEKAYMSESNFYRVFKQELGQSPIDFINEERIALATKLLENKEYNLTDVFLSCGFKNRSYFNRMFKRLTGTSPGRYQKHFMQPLAKPLNPSLNS
ncbi:AraC family transcriptional regulator [Pseudozobellia sp. WGM2]|uniref:AraC family transcriptional regulator n=1 Tax=Pseudozobellia sp. WGM2 TaxID=2787625 RepID=UPI001AE0E19F|nr:AraC family transcriptional regulator [Pseudozobellia sp. WGM2]